MPVTPDPPGRPKDKYLAKVVDWRGGCLLCGEVVAERLPPVMHDVEFPLCDKHVRWALASRRERIGHQAGNLRGFLLAWCRHRNADPAPVRAWLGY